MARYLAPDLIKQSVNRLRASRAQSRLLEYLIFRRALELSGGAGNEVVTGMASAPFQQAIREWARVRPDTGQAPHFFNPFGTGETADGGYRNDKFPSNGASDTVGRWGNAMTDPPFLRVKGVKPMTFTFTAISGAELEKNFLRAKSPDPNKNHRPRLADTAVWWLRDRDLDSLGLNDQIELTDLIDTLRREVGLSSEEESALFFPELV